MGGGVGGGAGGDPGLGMPSPSSVGGPAYPYHSTGGRDSQPKPRKVVYKGNAPAAKKGPSAAEQKAAAEKKRKKKEKAERRKSRSLLTGYTDPNVQQRKLRRTSDGGTLGENTSSQLY